MRRLSLVSVTVIAFTILLGACGADDSLDIIPTAVPSDTARSSEGGSSYPSPLSLVVTAARAVAASSAGASATPVPGPAGTPATSPQVTDGGNFRLLISDEKNAIEDFASLLVSIDRVGLQQGGESGGWTEFDVPEQDATVDLVLLQGDNAQEVLKASVSPGQYSKVFIHVNEVTGFLLADPTTSFTIKLPSNKLQINMPFEVFESFVTTFVYDITVVAAGNQKSGIKYILKPVITESGAAQPFEEVKPDDGQKDGGKELILRLEDDPLPGATSTLVVTDSDGNPVPNATISVNGETVGATDASGQLMIAIPADAGKLELEARLDDAEGELEIEFETRADVSATATTTQVQDDSSGVAGPLTLTLEGPTQAGATSTLLVTDSDGNPVPNAAISVNGQSVGATDSIGQFIIAIPADVGKVELEARLDDAEGELEIEL